MNNVSSELKNGEEVLLIDRRDRRYLVLLSAGGEFHTHSGVVFHDSIIGTDDGGVIESTTGTKYVVIRPTMAQRVIKMPRGAQVIYPKDLGAILMRADIFPGASVLEAGVGSGALSMTLLRAGATVTGIELREDFANRARKNVERALGAETLSRYNVSIGDVYEGIPDEGFDRIVLDLAEPWQVVKHAENALKQGGIFLAYLPTITQVVTLRDTLEQSSFMMAETIEVLERSWHIEGQSVRPDHRMVAHTGFLTTARLGAQKVL